MPTLSAKRRLWRCSGPPPVKLSSKSRRSDTRKLCAPRVAESVTVTDEAIREAQTRLWSELQVAAEPGGAAALAALTGGAYRASPGERVGVLVCGGNVALDTIQAPA